MSADDVDGEGTATWDGPMVWQEDQAGGQWDHGDGWGPAAGGAWDGDNVTTTVGAWEDGHRWAQPYGYEPGYQGGYAATQYAQTGYSETAYRRSRQEALTAYADNGEAPAPTVWEQGDGGRRHQRRRSRRGNGPWPELVMITAVAVIIAAVILAVTSADRTTLATTQGSAPTLVPTTTAPSKAHPSSSVPSRAASGRSAVHPVKKPKTVPTTTVPVGGEAQNKLVTAGVEDSLIRSWLSTNPGGAGLDASDVAGTEPGQVYYADQPATGTWWALVAFKPSATLLREASTAAGQEKLAQFQNSIYAFSWKQGPVWTLLGEVSTGSCPNVVPTAVLSVWGMCGL
jgi:hypothetical protein